MPAITLLNMLCDIHNTYAAVGNIEASDNVKIGGVGIHRHGDGWPDHANPSGDVHNGATTISTSTVRVNGKPVARIGDLTTCGATIVEGNTKNVFAGD